MSSNSESYLDWADKGRSSFLIYLIGFILIVLFWLLLGEFFSAPIRSLVQSGFDESVAGTLLIDFSSFLPALIVVPLATKYLLARPWWSFGFPNLRPDFSVFALALLVSLAHRPTEGVCMHICYMCVCVHIYIYMYMCIYI